MKLSIFTPIGMAYARHYQLTLILLALAPLAVLSSKMAANLWPGLHYDAVLYSTIVLNYATGHGLTFDVYAPALLENPSGQMRSHGLFSYVFYSKIFNATTYKSYFSAINIVTQLTVYLFALLVYLRTLSNRFFGTTLCVGAAWALLPVLIQIQGRPEHLIPLALVVGELLVFATRANRNFKYGIRGAQLGLIAAISPAPAVLYLSCLIFYYASTLDQVRFLRVLLILALWSLMSWASITNLIYDQSIFELVVNSSSDIDRRALREIPAMWLLNPSTPLVAVIYFQMSALLIFAALNGLKNRSFIIRVAALILFINVLYWAFLSGIKNPPVNYRALSLFPVAFLFVVQRVELMTQEGAHAFINKLILIASITVLSTGSIALVKQEGGLLKSGASYFDAKRAYDGIKSRLKENEIIGIDQWGLYTDVVLDSPPWAMMSLPFPNDEQKILDIENRLNVFYRFYLKTCKNMDKIERVIGPFVIQDDYEKVDCSRQPGYGFVLYARRENY